MRTKQISYIGTIFIFILSIVIAAAIATIASIQLGLSLAETMLTTMLIVSLALVSHMVFMLSGRQDDENDASLDQKIHFIANEIAALRKQQANMRQHFDHELKYMHGLNKATDDSLQKMSENIETNLANVIGQLVDHSNYPTNTEQLNEFTQAKQLDLPKAVKPNTKQNLTNDNAALKVDVEDSELLEALNDSLADNKVDLYAQPIVTLPARHIAYYESYTWIRDSNGKVITPREYLDTAERAGIMPVIDNLMLFRSVLLARRFVERNRSLKIFCNISGHSLLDVTFFDQFIEFMGKNKEQSKLLIFEFSQKTLDETGIIESEALMTLADLGYRFSLDNVVDLNIDIKKLYNLGFRYLKINANIFLNNAEAHGAQILVDDFAEHISRAGLELIIDGVQNEHIVPELLDYNIKYAQGFLFGEPTLVRDKSHLLDAVKKTA